MHNLILINDIHRVLHQQPSSSSFTAFSLDPTLGVGYILVGYQLLACESQERRIIWSISLSSFSQDGIKRHWLFAAYIGETNAVFVAAREGELLSVDCETQDINIVGVVEAGILGASQSPDEEVLLIFTADGNILCMTADYEVINEVPLIHPIHQEKQLHSPISSSSSGLHAISWRGDGEFFAILANEEAEVLEKHPAEQIQPNGAALTTSSINKRVVRVFSKEGLSSHSLGRHEDESPVLGLGSALAWSNDGSLIAATQETKGRLQVVFFERNGLRHREFLLRDIDLVQDSVDFLSWNAESTILAVGINARQGGTEAPRVQLWHRNNYHWYLKYEEQVTVRQKRICLMQFDKEKANRLHVILSSSSTSTSSPLGGGGREKEELQWQSLDFCWDVNVSETRLRTVAVIDGRELCLTSMGVSIVPPPMSAAKILTDSPIKAVTFLSTTTPLEEEDLSKSAYLACLTSKDTIEVYREAFAAKGMEGAHVCSLSMLDDGGGDKSQEENRGAAKMMSARQLLMVAKGNALSILIACWDSQQEEDVLIEVDVEGDNRRRTAVTGKVLRLERWGRDDHRSALVELVDGRIFRYIDGKLMAWQQEEHHHHHDEQEQHVLLEPCPWIKMVQLSAPSSSPRDEHDNPSPSCTSMVLGLSDRSRLYFGEYLACGAVSSFVVSYSLGMVMYVTLGSRPQLRFIPFEELRALDVMAGSEGGMVEGLESRALERGARLITTLISSPSVIVQLPRGNLEAVCPRALVLYAAGRLLDGSRYGQAFAMLRRHNGDMNLLVDYDPARFEEEVELFIEQVSRTDLLNIFISALHCSNAAEGKDACLEMDEMVKAFRSATSHTRKRGTGPLPSWFPHEKRNRVCGILRRALEARQGASSSSAVSSSSSVLEPILTTLARQSPPNFEAALELIRKEIKERRKERLSSECSQRLIRYLAFFTDMNSLFTIALGMYDLDLARAVARQSQKDPREYLPLLEKLQAMDSWKARVAIDVQLKRPLRALSHMAERSSEELDEDEVCKMVIDADVHEAALSLFGKARFPSLHCKILRLLAEQLTAKGEHRKAMLAYLSQAPSDLLGAAEAARATGDWRMALSLLAQDEAKSSSSRAEGVERIVAIWARQLVQENLQAAGSDRRDRLKDAAVICMDYLNDVEGAVIALIASSSWSEAMRIAWKAQRGDLVEVDIKNAVLDASEGLQMDFESWTLKYGEMRGQLVDVLERLKAEAEELGAADFDQRGDEFSLFSAATNDTMASAASYRSTSTTASHATVHSRLTWSNATTLSGASSVMNGSRREKRIKKKKNKRVKRTLREEEADIRSGVKTLMPSPSLMNDVKDLLEMLVFFAEVNCAKALYKSVQEHLEFCLSHPLPPPPPSTETVADGNQPTTTGGGGEKNDGVGMYDDAGSTSLFFTRYSFLLKFDEGQLVKA